ncbi:SGNH/GDSL hydrolase family protein [Virgibacillus sp. 179-BFC.A HS]|uniref:SGNH/GDSL hydrolase family protein n=1 Tax=Tigheibacillus jepli TaxID=3035914 RepID=A0ABU5CDT3_9BACI|nr:SGNH/GDSL hydrolase family protein [Virgibacillus sp. 179-BFC.A HS]MDY0404469.1 SGNH/GDSL hydrolase family protein [Virgibacillus sp. 179-BFC.A HS]
MRIRPAKNSGFFLPEKTNFVAIGDSLTQGVGDVTNQGGYVGLLDDTINQDKKLATFENYGKRGNRTDQLIKRLDEDEIAESVKKADVILITIGANDIMEVLKENITNITMSVFAEERVHYEDRLHVLFDKLRILNKNAKIYLVGFYNPFEQYFQDIDELDEIVDRWNATSRKVVATYDDITFIPTKDLFHNKSNLFASDNFHPNIYGYELIAKRVLTYITQ